MFDTKTVSLEWGGKTLTLETGRIARQADGAVLATYGETVVLCAVTAAKSVREGQDFFPLTVHYQEKFSAAGRIPGGFFKREGRATEKETLTSRLIDRPVRPLFPEGFYNEINVIAQVLSFDGETEPDIVAMIAASAALTISGVPFMGPIGAARVGYIDGEYVLNPTADQLAKSELDLVVAGTNEGVLMVESQANELTEEVMLGAVMFGHEAYQEVINAIIDLAERAAKEPRPVEETPQEILALEAKVRELGEAGIREAIAGGVLAGYPLVDVRVEVVDGSYHEVDSNELAFKMAGIFAVKEACKKANLVLLEPIMKVEVVTPEESQGDVMGDLNRRRGKILGMEMDSKQICTLTCEVPLAEMFGYATAVRSLSKGRASYSMEPFSFEEVPSSIAEEVISGKTKEPART